ncbi:MAG: hypothetical protein J6J79_00745 [Lachnospiraceae bacterium]|nr:hypothetical protein [Lachnospiraceae bacterium]
MNAINFDAAVIAALSTFFVAYFIVALAICVVVYVAMWKVFEKAGKPGWACLIPFYNMYCLFDMAFGNGLFFLLLFVPCANIVFIIMLYFKLASAFGQGVGFGFGLLFLSPIFMLILGFGKAEYIGPQ